MGAEKSLTYSLIPDLSNLETSGNENWLLKNLQLYMWFVLHVFLLYIDVLDFRIYSASRGNKELLQISKKNIRNSTGQ